MNKTEIGRRGEALAEGFLKRKGYKILDRNWMEKREGIKRKIQSGQCTDEEALLLLREFDELKRAQPNVIVPEPEENSAASACEVWKKL